MSEASKTRNLNSQWTLRIVDRLRHGPMRYGELERWTEMPRAPMFSAHLKKMIRDGLIVRNVKSLGPPAVVFYELTDLGRSLSEPAYALLNWISANKTKVFEARAYGRDDGQATVRRDAAAS